jgi:hypothetical protein
VPADLPYLGLAEPRLEKRRPGAVLAGRFHARPELPEVVLLGSVGDRAEPEPRGLLTEDPEELGLAEVAAPVPVLEEAGVFHLARVDEPMRRADLARDPRRLLFLGPRKAGRDGGDSDRTIPQDVVGRPQQKGAVHARREAHRHRADTGNRIPQPLEAFRDAQREAPGCRSSGGLPSRLA